MKIAMLAGLAGLLLASPALAGDARCYTSDDGDYDCWLEAIADDGSFRISADGMPTFELWVESPGIATVGATFEKGGRSTPLPGMYHRSESDGACWVSDATDTEICAW